VDDAHKRAIARLTARLDRPGTRPLLAFGASAALTTRNRELCRVHYRSGRWEHHLGYASVASPNLLIRGPRDWEAAFEEAWTRTYVPGRDDRVVDVGAGVGSEVYPLSKRVGAGGRVIAIEAVPAVADCLEWTVRTNHLTNVEVHQVAVSDTTGEVEISADLGSHVHNSVVPNDLFLRCAKTERVRTQTLDDLLKDVPRVDWLKMNIEGAERQALVGAGQVLHRTGHVVVSCHDFIADAGGPEALRTAAFVTEVLGDHGFTLARRDDPRPWVRDQIWGERQGWDARRVVD
jgi:FkbM family methyltransferase